MDSDSSYINGNQRAQGPRKPERANGRRRYEHLLDAAERLLLQDGPEALTIQRLAREASVPTSSVYHFFPSPVSVSIGLSERYLAGLAEHIGAGVDAVERLSWQGIVSMLMDRAVTYYKVHPYAQRLILGSDHSWQIRQSDRANNRMLAAAIAAMLADRFPDAGRDELLHAIMIGISIGDAVLTLSIFEHGTITPEFGREATVAICGYMSARFGAGTDPDAP